MAPSHARSLSALVVVVSEFNPLKVVHFYRGSENGQPSYVRGREGMFQVKLQRPEAQSGVSAADAHCIPRSSACRRPMGGEGSMSG